MVRSITNEYESCSLMVGIYVAVVEKKRELDEFRKQVSQRQGHRGRGKKKVCFSGYGKYMV